MCNKNCISGCWGGPPKGPFGIKIKNWWIFLLTIACLVVTIGYSMVLVGLAMVVACCMGFVTPMVTAVVFLIVSSVVMYAAIMRANHYWKLLHGPWFTGVTLPAVNKKFPELKLEEISNVQRLDKIGAEFYEGPEQKFDGPEGS